MWVLCLNAAITTALDSTVSTDLPVDQMLWSPELFVMSNWVKGSHCTLHVWVTDSETSCVCTMIRIWSECITSTQSELVYHGYYSMLQTSQCTGPQPINVYISPRVGRQTLAVTSAAQERKTDVTQMLTYWHLLQIQATHDNNVHAAVGHGLSRLYQISNGYWRGL